MADTDKTRDDGKGAAGKGKKAGGGKIPIVIALAGVTVLAGALGAVTGMTAGGKVRDAVTSEYRSLPAVAKNSSTTVSGDTVLQVIEPVISNLSDPKNIWVRLETAMVYRNGALENPDVIAAEVRQDMLAYVRTLRLAQLEGPSALQHLREDLNERAKLRSRGAVDEIVVQSFVVQ